MHDSPVPKSRPTGSQTGRPESGGGSSPVSGHESSPGAAVTTTGRHSGFRAHVGYRAAVWREGYAEVELDAADVHMNSLARVHGGVHMTLLDAAMGHAAAWCSVAGNARPSVTVSLNTNFLAAGRPGLLRAIGRLEAIHGRMAFCTGQIVDADGAVLVTGQATFRYFPGAERVEGIPRGEIRR